MIGNTLETEDAVGGHDAAVLHVDAEKAGCLSPDADDEVVELVALITGHHGVSVDDALRANDLHALAFARGFDALAHRQDDLLLALHHPGEVHLGLGNADAERCGVADLAKHIGAGKQRLGGNAAPVQARAAEFGALDDGDLGAELRGAKRGNITGGPTAEHHDALGHAVVGVAAGRAVDLPSRPRRDMANASVTMRSCSS